MAQIGVQARQRSTQARRLRGFESLAKMITGVKSKDGIDVE